VSLSSGLTKQITDRFLPYTVHFNVNVRKPQTRPSPPQRLPSRPDVSLFVEGLGGPSPLATPAIPTEHEQFFLSNKLHPSSPYHSQVQQLVNLPLPTPSETHSPLWGRGYFNQPRSRAEDPPPVSILKHSKIGTKPASSRAASISDIREESHERALKTADWSIQPAEQGNPAIRNAIHAVERSGLVKEKTWVNRSAGRL